MNVELANCQAVILQAVESGSSAKALSYHYAFCICSPEKPDFKIINEAILTRFKPSGLKRIKESAWKLIDKLNEPKK